MPLLFSYGTLQQDNIQLSVFGRRLVGEPDELLGFEQTLLRIDDPAVIAASGKSQHPIAKFNGLSASRVRGTVFEISDAELISADRYEIAAYERMATTLASGKQAWVYAARLTSTAC